MHQYSYAENSMDKRFWWATVHGVTKSPTTEHSTHSSCRQQQQGLLQPFSVCINHLLNNFFFSSAEITVKPQNSLVYRIDMYKIKLFAHLYFFQNRAFQALMCMWVSGYLVKRQILQIRDRACESVFPSQSQGYSCC